MEFFGSIYSHMSLGFSVALTPINLLFCLIGVTLGTLIGALPGLGSVTGVAILLPLTFGMDPTTAIIMLSGKGLTGALQLFGASQLCMMTIDNPGLVDAYLDHEHRIKG